jgi:iron complex transport system substrate-binding protein
MPRRTLSLLALALTALLVAACGAQEDDSRSGGQAATATEAQASAAPRTIRHAGGSTRIEGVPKRIVALDGNQDIDSLLALGLQPTAMASLGGGERPPYQQQRLSPDIVQMKSVRSEPNLEEVLGLRPDLILTAEYDEKLYDELEKIAPTIAYDRDAGWQEAFRQIAQAVGRGEQAEEHIRKVEAKYAPTREIVEQTGFDQIRLGMIYPYPEYYYGYGASGHPGEVMARAGVTRFVEPPGKQDTKIFGGHNFSAERLTYLKPAELILSFEDGAEATDELKRLEQKDRVWQQLPAVREGRVDTVPQGPFYQQTALTVPLVLDEVAKLAREHGPAATG